mgnify:CR=1 FL=1
MFDCERCKMSFDTNWRLTRHLNRKFPCKQYTQNDLTITQNDLTITQNDLTITQNDLRDTQNDLRCKYCNKICGKHLKRHEKNCKLAKDEIRILEIELDIPFKVCDKLTCRFCNKSFSRVSNVTQHQITCNDKQIYFATLQGKKISKDNGGGQVNVTVNINNTTNNDNRTQTQNNFIAKNGEPLRKFGDENIDYILKEEFMKYMKQGHEEVIPKMVHKIHCNDDHPENNNVKFTNLRSEQISVYNGETFITKPTQDILYKIINNTMNRMYELYDNFNEEHANICENNMFVRSTFNHFDNGNYDEKSRKDTRNDRNAIKCKLYDFWYGRHNHAKIRS